MLDTPVLLTPHDLTGLAAALARMTPRSRLLAGGTDLLLQLRAGEVQPELLVDLSGVQALSKLECSVERIRIGATTPLARLCTHPHLAQVATCLTQAAANVGSMQIRNMATLGGNVANASPCADTIPALLVLGADVGLLQADGSMRRAPLQHILLQGGRTRLRHNEAIIDFSFAAAAPTWRSAFAKLGTRSAVTVAKMNAALVVDLAPDGHAIAQVRVAFGSLARVAFEDATLAAVLRGAPTDPQTAHRFANACASMVERTIPDRPSMAYKRHAVRGLAYDLWNRLGICAAVQPDFA